MSIAQAFICVECGEQRPAAELAYDTDPEVYLGVCVGCDDKLHEAEAIPAPWREAA